MSLILPDPRSLEKTSEKDFFYWNYQFPIKYIQRYRFKAVVNLIADRIFGSMLEVGTGSGIFLLELAKHCRKLYAIDVHENMNAVERLCQAYSINAMIDQRSIENTSFPDNMFDCIVAVSVLEFIENLEKAFYEIKRILHSDGVFITIYPHRNLVLNTLVYLKTRHSSKNEVINVDAEVTSKLESNFKIIEKHVFPKSLSRIFPVYRFYKLSKKEF